MMMEKVPTGTIDASKPQPYTPHLKKVLKTYQKSAIKSLQGPSTVLSAAGNDTISSPSSSSSSSSSSSLSSVKKEPGSDSSPELPLETPPLSSVQPPIPPVPILSAADQSSELSNTYIEGQRVACFIIGGEKRICFPQLLSSVLRAVPAYTINNVSTELHINFSSCNSDQLNALKEEGLLPAETPTCGLVTKPDAERLCSVLLHEGGVAADEMDKHADYSFQVYHECFSGAKGVLYYEFYTERNWCVQCVICRRLFTPQMFVAHSCCMDKKRNSVHTYIEPGICHWGFDSANWRLYIHVVEEQPEFEKFSKIMETFKSQHRRSELVPMKRKQEMTENAKLGKSVIEELPSTPKVERNDDEEEERWYMKKKAKLVPTSAPAAPTTTEGNSTVPCSSLPPLYCNSFSEFYSNLYDSWVRSHAAAVASYQVPPTWTPYSPLPFPKESKAYYFTEAVPPFLAQDPPVLLHPERVVPLSQSEQFERSYQPNVALAPPTKPSSDSISYSKLKRGVIRVKSDLSSPSPNDETSSFFSKEARLDKPDVKPSISPIGSTLHNPTSPRSSPVTEPVPDGVNNSVVEQVAAVLDALSDAEDAVRQRVIHLVERLTVRIDRCDVERRKYQEEISRLSSRLSNVEEENSQLHFINSQLRLHLESKHLSHYQEPPQSDDKDSALHTRSSTPNAKCSTSTGVRLTNSSATYSPSNHNTPGISSKQPNCSPVSVITSPPPLTVIKSESA